MWHKDAARLGHYCITLLRPCTLSPLSLLSLSLSRQHRSLARLVRCIIIATTEQGGGEGGEACVRVRCNFRQKPRTVPSLLAERFIHAKRTRAWIEFNIPWIRDFACGGRAIFMLMLAKTR